MNKELSRLLTQKFRAWEKEMGSRQTVSAWARHLGYNQVTLNRWLNGDSKPEGENLRQLAKQLGPEIYDALGVPPPADMGSGIDQLPPEILRRLRMAGREIERTFIERKLTGEMPEAEQVAIEIMERHGFKYTHTESDDEAAK